MRSALRFLLLCLALASGAAQAAGPLLTPAELQPLAAAGAVRLIDVREGPAYALQHLPGAVSAPYGRWRAEAPRVPGPQPQRPHPRHRGPRRG